jgi:ribonuclease E
MSDPAVNGRPNRSSDNENDDKSYDKNPEELPERHIEGKPKSTEAAERALVKRPQIGDTRPAPMSPSDGDESGGDGEGSKPRRRRRRRGGRGRSGGGANQGGGNQQGTKKGGGNANRGQGGGRGNGGRGGGSPGTPVEAITVDEGVELDDETLELRKGRERKGKPVGRYLMTVAVRDEATQIAVLEGRNLIEHYVSRPSDDVSQIHGNVYLGRVQNVLPGMEAAFVDIATPKNAVLYKGDVQYDAEDILPAAVSSKDHDSGIKPPRNG